MDICGGFYRGKRVLVTGHTGFVGHWLFKVLNMAGASVVGYSIDVQKDDPYDIRNKSRLEQFFAEVQPEIVFHLAAQTDADYAISDPAGTYETNVMGVVNVLEAARKDEGVRSIILASSNQIYEDKEGPWAYRENDPLAGREPLTASKICAESILTTYRKSFFMGYQGTALSSARFGNVFGGGDYRKGRIIPDCIEAAKANRIIEVHDSTSVRPYIHVLDIVKGLLVLAQRQYEEKRFEGEYNFGPEYNDCMLTSDLVMLFCKEWGDGVSSRLAVPMESVQEPQKIRLDISKSKSLLLWAPKWDGELAVKKLVEWEKTVIREGTTDNIINKQIVEFME